MVLQMRSTMRIYNYCIYLWYWKRYLEWYGWNDNGVSSGSSVTHDRDGMCKFNGQIRILWTKILASMRVAPKEMPSKIWGGIWSHICLLNLPLLLWGTINGEDIFQLRLIINSIFIDVNGISIQLHHSFEWENDTLEHSGYILQSIATTISKIAWWRQI